MCKEIFDKGSFINVVVKTLISHLRLSLIDHPHPYHDAWIDALIPLKKMSFTT